VQVSYHPRASVEVIAEVAFYDERSPGLGNAFRESVDRAVQRIRENPMRFPPGPHDTRRCPLAQFPHRVVYRVEKDFIRVYAIAHPKHRPDYWQNRV